MLISELIERLQEFQIQHGDLPVFHWDDWDAFSVQEINFREENE